FDTLENLRIASRTSGNALDKHRARDVLERIGLSRQQNLPARALSAGQRRRLPVARFLTSRARLWLLDEVLTSLDDAATTLSAQFISDHLKNNGIAIVAT